MKKILIFAVFALLSLGLVAQDQIIDMNGADMNKGFTLTTAARKTAAYSYTYAVNNLKYPYLYTYSVRIQDLGGVPKGNTATLVISGSADGSQYKTITTITLAAKAVGADTALIGNITSAPVSYKYMKFTITPSDTIWVKSIFFTPVISK